MRLTCLANCPYRVLPDLGFCTEHWPALTAEEQDRIRRASGLRRKAEQLRAKAAWRRRNPER